jgi:hypothetical protein
LKKILKHIIISFIAILLICCKKKNSDTLSTHNIHGQVYNLCTNKGLANVTVFLNSSGPSNSSFSVVSDVNGNFNFSNIQIHSSDEYTYSLFIPSKSGIGNGPEIGFDGIDAVLNKSSLDQNQICRVAPHFKNWNLYFPNTLFTSSDTFVLTMQQNIIHFNSPNSNFRSIDSCPCPITTPTHLAGGLNNYWMGWWHVTLNKTKNSVHIINTDSFFVDWGATKTDTIPW